MTRFKQLIMLPAEAGTRLPAQWLAALALLRIMQGLLVDTYFNPDEFWQLHEVAYNMAFGCGHLTWEWSSESRLRSPILPSLLACLYKLLAACGLDSRFLISNSPRLLQALAACLADAAVFELTGTVFGPLPAKWALFCQVTNWFNGYCLVRPFGNSVETVFATIAFARFVRQQSLFSWIVFTACACMLRFTCFSFFVAPFLVALMREKDAVVRAATCARTAALALCFVIAQVAVDSAYYGVFTWSAIQLFRFNSSNSALYGVHHPLWYFTEGVPAIVGTMLPLLFFSRWGNGCHVITISVSIALYLAPLSMVPHKEFRFILPLLPLFMAFAGDGLWRISLRRPGCLRPIVGFLVLSNAAALFFLGRIHQRAPLTLLAYLAEERARSPEAFSVDFLLPCHATPFMAHLHVRNLSPHCPDARFLDCSPQLLPDGQLSREYTDSALLERDGPVFLKEYYARAGTRLPRFVVINTEAHANLSTALLGYRRVSRFEHAVDSDALVLLRHE